MFGPWPANIGREGFAPPDQKREGDDRTPTGAYEFDFAFGVLADPGVQLPYRRVTSDAIVWDDDPTSTRYNLWTDTPTQSPGADPEPMYNQPAYNYGVVIDYNADAHAGARERDLPARHEGQPDRRVRRRLRRTDLVELLRWLDPAKRPRIVMGTRAALTP